MTVLKKMAFHLQYKKLKSMPAPGQRDMRRSHSKYILYRICALLKIDRAEKTASVRFWF